MFAFVTAINKKLMKKNLFFLLILSGIVSLGHAQLRKIPSEVTDALKAKYPSAEKVEWKDKLTFFQADFINEGYSTSADFDSKGSWLETDKEIAFANLPTAVKDGFQKTKYTSEWKTGTVIEIQKPSEALQYRIFIQKSGVQKKFLYFDKAGKLLREAITI